MVKPFCLYFIVLIFAAPLFTKDYGVRGHLFPIQEEDLLAVINRKLTNLAKGGELQKHHTLIAACVQHFLERPKPVPFITRAVRSRVFMYDPSVKVPYDLKDHNGDVFHKAGKTINPLSLSELSKKLVFIDGDDKAQVTWATLFPLANTKIILTSGAPFEVMGATRRPIYFDQGGCLVSKLGIKHVPCVVSQKGLYLHIEEKVL